MGIRRRSTERSSPADGVDGVSVIIAAPPAPAVEIEMPPPAAARPRTVADAITTALELERDRYEIALVHAESEELIRTGLLVTMRDLEVLGSAAHFYSETYENPERRYPQVLARRERARRIGRTLWRFAVDRCGIEEADRAPTRVGSA